MSLREVREYECTKCGVRRSMYDDIGNLIDISNIECDGCELRREMKKDIGKTILESLGIKQQ